MNDWIEKDPFLKYKGKVREVERVYLSQEEIESILNKEFKIRRLELVRDMFLFSCFTGLAYIDVFNLTKSNIIIGIDGNKWVSTHRQKKNLFLKFQYYRLLKWLLINMKIIHYA